MTKKNEIFIRNSREGYSLYYGEKYAFTQPKIVINSMKFYNIVDGLLGMSKNIYKKGIKKIYFNEDDYFKIPKKEKKIFKGLINTLERFAIGEKNLEYKIEEIKKILINKENRKKFLTNELSRNQEESFNSLYKIIKSKKPHERKKE